MKHSSGYHLPNNDVLCVSPISPSVGLPLSSSERYLPCFRFYLSYEYCPAPDTSFSSALPQKEQIAMRCEQITSYSFKNTTRIYKTVNYCYVILHPPNEDKYTSYNLVRWYASSFCLPIRSFSRIFPPCGGTSILVQFFVGLAILVFAVILTRPASSACILFSSVFQWIFSGILISAKIVPYGGATASYWSYYEGMR